MIDYLLNIQLFSYMYMQDENKFSTKYKNYIEIREAWAYCVLTATGEVSRLP